MSKPSSLKWFGAGASVPGPYHDRDPKRCEDAWMCLNRRSHLVAVVCDGAGSAKHARSAARLAVSTLTCLLFRSLTTKHDMFSSLQKSGNSSIAYPKWDFWQTEIIQCIKITRDRLISEANMQKHDLEDYLCTIVGVVANYRHGLFFHIGDGAAGAFDDSQFESDEHIISYPENGKNPEETFFLVDKNWRKHTRFTPFSGKNSIVLATDGATTFLFTNKYKKLEKAFCLPVKRHLDKMDGRVMRSKSLRAILNQPDAEKTSSGHDDKTIVWVYFRKCPAP